jgi:hypothetical protein
MIDSATWYSTGSSYARCVAYIFSKVHRKDSSAFAQFPVLHNFHFATILQHGNSLRIRNVRGSNLDPKAGSPDWGLLWFFVKNSQANDRNTGPRSPHSALITSGWILVNWSGLSWIAVKWSGLSKKSLSDRLNRKAIKWLGISRKAVKQLGFSRKSANLQGRSTK